jgi:hypothetical protein
VAGQILKNLVVAHGEVGALRIYFQNLKFFLPIQISLKTAYSIFLKFVSRFLKILAGIYP